jgi:hypothetical protein
VCHAGDDAALRRGARQVVGDLIERAVHLFPDQRHGRDDDNGDEGGRALVLGERI